MHPFESTSGETSSRGGTSTQVRRVLFVELDRTLMATQLDWEVAAAAVRRDPWAALYMPLWRSTGRGNWRRNSAERGLPKLELLPYRETVLNFIRERREAGWHVVLVAAADAQVARAVADSVGLFDDVMAGAAGDAQGESRRQRLEMYCREHGFQDFAYVGHRSTDVAVWSGASEAVLVNPSPALERRTRRPERPTVVLRTEQPGSTWRSLARAMRPHHWVKNLLVFTPVLFHHSFTDLRLWSLSSLAFALFCATTSAVYVLNDLLDVESDRRHPVKRTRPFAAGKLRVEHGLITAVSLLVASFAVSVVALPIEFAGALLAYVALNALYSTWLKRKVMIDILVLASFYCLRIVAGGAATGIVPSEWLLALSMFMFLSLAFLKRHGELVRLRDEGLVRTDNRGYRVHDLEMLETMGATSGYLAVLVLALYINSRQVQGLYSHPRVLWLICPLLLYWISRAWIWARRGALVEDPLMFALKDRVSWVVLILVVVLAIFSL